MLASAKRISDFLSEKIPHKREDAKGPTSFGIYYEKVY